MEFDRKFGAIAARFCGVNMLVEMRRGNGVDGMRRNIDFAGEFFGKWEMKRRGAANHHSLSLLSLTSISGKIER